MKPKTGWLFLLFFLCCMQLRAQILNIDKSDTADYQPRAKINFTFNAGLEIDKQKKTLYDATNNGELLVQKSRELYILAASYRFTYNGPNDFLNAGYVHFRLRYNYKNRYQPETFWQYQWDNTRGLLYRRLAGANIRYNFWKGDKIDFNAAAGLMYEEEKWDYDGVDSIKIPTSPHDIVNRLLKVNSYIRLDWKTAANSELAITVFLQTRPGNFSPRIAPLMQWNIAAGKHVGFSVGLNSLYDASPVVPISHFYYNFSNSFYLKW